MLHSLFLHSLTHFSLSLFSFFFRFLPQEPTGNCPVEILAVAPVLCLRLLWFFTLPTNILLILFYPPFLDEICCISADQERKMQLHWVTCLHLHFYNVCVRVCVSFKKLLKKANVIWFAAYNCFFLPGWKQVINVICSGVY